MGSYIADTGYASAYTMSSEALVFNELAEKFPYLIDYVINEDQTANENFREMVTELIAVREHHANHVTLHGGKDPSLGALVTNIDRGAIWHWLVHAPQSRRKQFRTCSRLSNSPMRYATASSHGSTSRIQRNAPPGF